MFTQKKILSDLKNDRCWHFHIVILSFNHLKFYKMETILIIESIVFTVIFLIMASNLSKIRKNTELTARYLATFTNYKDRGQQYKCPYCGKKYMGEQDHCPKCKRKISYKEKNRLIELIEKI